MVAGFEAAMAGWSWDEAGGGWGGGGREDIKSCLVELVKFVDMITMVKCIYYSIFIDIQG